MDTKTPVTWTRESGGNTHYIKAPDSRFAGGRTIARVDAGYDASPSYATRLWTVFPDAEANADLLAAAPELAEALEAIRKHELAAAADLEAAGVPVPVLPWMAQLEKALHAAGRL